MTSVLVVDDDEVLRADVAQELRTQGYDVAEARSVDEAVSALSSSPPDVLLTDLRMDGQDGVDLLSAAREIAPDTLSILMSGFATAQDYQRATDLGAVRVLTKPFTPQQMLAAVAHALDCGTGFRGSVHGISLVDMLQMFHFGRRTITLHIGGTEGATISFRDGEIVDARTGSTTGVAALRAILDRPSGAMSTSVPIGDPQITIEEPFQGLLMDTLRELDEGEGGDGRSDSDTLELAMDDAFEEWASLRPRAAERDDTDRLRSIGPLLERLAPQVGAAVVDELSARVIPLRGFEASTDWMVVTCALQKDLARLTSEDGYQQFEYVGGDLAFALLRNPAESYTLVLETPLLDRLAPQRFRSQVRQIVTYLPGVIDGASGSEA
ncbi:MAG: response regulator [Myxococcales bacterium]|jgi:CheY-like chemotaxis protein